MTAITDSRKRSREEDGCDFMPLSKRITNLHINQSSSTTTTPMQSDNDITDYNINVNNHHHQQQQQQQQHHHQTLQFQNHNQFGPFVPMANGESNQFSEFSNLSHPIDVQERHYRQYLSECNNASSSNGSSNLSSNENHFEPPHYDPYEPELSQEQNPFYYTKNKLLYDLYLERLRRHQ